MSSISSANSSANMGVWKPGAIGALPRFGGLPNSASGKASVASVSTRVATKAQRESVIPSPDCRHNGPRLGGIKLHGALLKNEQDVHLFERLAFMARRDR